MTDKAQKQLDTVKATVMSLVTKLPSHAFGHGYLWGCVTIRSKNTKNFKNYKVLFNSVCVWRILMLLSSLQIVRLMFMGHISISTKYLLT
jgi:hypothetical protein